MPLEDNLRKALLQILFIVHIIEIDARLTAYNEGCTMYSQWNFSIFNFKVIQQSIQPYNLSCRLIEQPGAEKLENEEMGTGSTYDVTGCSPSQILSFILEIQIQINTLVKGTET